MIRTLEKMPGVGLLETPEAFYDALHNWVSTWYKFHPRQAEHPWRLVLQFSNHRHAVYGFDNPPSKDVMFRVHQGAITAPVGPGGVRVVCAALLCEAWMLELEASPDEDSDPSVSTHPDRIECVLFNLITPSAQAIMSCPINRDDTHAKLLKKPFEYAVSVTGRAIRPTPPQEQP